MAKKKKLLVVDDIQMITDLFQYEFEDDFEVSVARNGAEELRLASAVRPDGILLDITMPDISGIEVTRRLAEQPETADIPVVVITGYPSTEAETQLKTCPNFKGFLSKMDPSRKIKEMVKEALKK
jgi:CheY-like chemotaxis protein